MKKLILLAVMFLVGMYSAGAQTTKVSDKTVVEGKSYVTSKSAKSSSDIATEHFHNFLLILFNTSMAHS